MKTLCAWCRAVIRDEDGTGGLDGHGISQGCAAKAEAEINPTKAVRIAYSSPAIKDSIPGSPFDFKDVRCSKGGRGE